MGHPALAVGMGYSTPADDRMNPQGLKESA
jgi:hypothetical protein